MTSVKLAILIAVSTTAVCQYTMTVEFSADAKGIASFIEASNINISHYIDSRKIVLDTYYMISDDVKQLKEKGYGKNIS